MFQTLMKMQRRESESSMCLHSDDTVSLSQDVAFTDWGMRLLITGAGEKKRLQRMKQSGKGKRKESTDESNSATEAEQSAENLDLGGFTSEAPALDALDTLDLGTPSWERLGDFPPTSTAQTNDGESWFVESSDESSNIDPGLLTTTGTLSQMILATASGQSHQSLDSSSLSSLSDGSLADSYLLPVHELTLLKAVMRIAHRMGCREELWSLTAASPFNTGFGPPPDELPKAWQPTPSQILVPHHPILDFLPWPSARDRLITIFTLPDEARPPNAVGPLALANFAYDMEDSSEGVRIYGGDPYDPGSWEVGQVFFSRWWFLFDREIVENSNRWRRLRGAPPLAITNG